ncbi:MAG TPA: hypothetical protein EYP58_04970 [bacterium (Candidatus Stahlbacteria)]|nr:hypothetical protein [Candidatus Stahlbacteria bacterium]
MDELTGLVAVILIFGMPIIIVVAAFICRYKSSKKKYEAMVKAIEMGKNPDEVKELFNIEAKKKSVKKNYSGYLRSGIVLAGIGSGLLGMGFISGEADLYGPGVFLLILGFALYVIYLIMKPQCQSEQENQ